METKINNSVDSVNMSQLLNDMINKINIFVKDKNYRYLLEGKEMNNIQMTDVIIKEVENESRTYRKKVLNRIIRLDKKMSLRLINLLLHTLDLGKIKVSEKEEQIRNARKEWLKLRKETEIALKKYKDEKGDFFKKIS
jgi:hypothetical protein